LFGKSAEEPFTLCSPGSVLGLINYILSPIANSRFEGLKLIPSKVTVYNPASVASTLIAWELISEKIGSVIEAHSEPKFTKVPLPAGIVPPLSETERHKTSEHETKNPFAAVSPP